MIKFLITLMLCCFCLNGQDEDGPFSEKGLRDIVGKDFESINKRAMKFFSNKGLPQTFKEINEYYDNLRECCHVKPTFLLGTHEEWTEFTTALLKLYPDFHQKPALKVIRLIMSEEIKHHFELEKDLKTWPDLLSNFKALPERVEEKLEMPAFRFLRLQQNKDGSWGEKEKLYCSSIALQAFLAHRETPISKRYGQTITKAIRYLINQVKVVKDKDVDILVWTLSEFYAMTGITIVETELLKLIPKIKVITNKKAPRDPKRFFFQSLALKSCYASGVESEKLFKNFRQQLDEFKDSKSLPLIAAQLLWGMDLKIYEDVFKKILIKLKNQDNSLLDELINWQFLWYSRRLQIGNIEINKEYRARLTQIIKIETKLKLDKRYSAKEAKLLEVVFPALIYGYVYPIRSLPTSRRINSVTPKSPNDRENEEGLDLVD